MDQAERDLVDKFPSGSPNDARVRNLVTHRTCLSWIAAPLFAELRCAPTTHRSRQCRPPSLYWKAVWTRGFGRSHTLEQSHCADYLLSCLPCNSVVTMSGRSRIRASTRPGGTSTLGFAKLEGGEGWRPRPTSRFGLLWDATPDSAAKVSLQVQLYPKYCLDCIAAASPSFMAFTEPRA